MLHQIAIGTFLILATVLASAGFYAVFEGQLDRRRAWLHTEPHRPKLVLVLVIAVFWTMAMMTASVSIWAIAFLRLDLFTTVEGAVYFALVAFTTLGFGDVLLPPEWELLGGMAAANGLLNFGILTATLVEGLRNVRRGQDEARRRDGGPAEID